MLQAACVDVKRFEGFFKNPLSLKDVSPMFHCSYVSHPSLWMMKGGGKKALLHCFPGTIKFIKWSGMWLLYKLSLNAKKIT